MSIEETIHQMGRQARAAAYRLAQLSTAEKNDILHAMATSLRERTADLLAANAKDIAAGEEKGLSAAMLDRLRLDEARVEAMAKGIDEVAAMFGEKFGDRIRKPQRAHGKIVHVVDAFTVTPEETQVAVLVDVALQRDQRGTGRNQSSKSDERCVVAAGSVQQQQR